jgi:hypothetical protein
VQSGPHPRIPRSSESQTATCTRTAPAPLSPSHSVTTVCILYHISSFPTKSFVVQLAFDACSYHSSSSCGSGSSSDRFHHLSAATRSPCATRSSDCLTFVLPNKRATLVIFLINHELNCHSATYSPLAATCVVVCRSCPLSARRKLR